MNLLTLPYWPLWAAFAGMAAALVINLREGARLPNALTFPFAAAGLALGLLHSLGVTPDAGRGGVAAALVCVVLTFVLSVPIYATGAVGAGSVKLQMAWGAWLGAFYGAGDGMDLAFWSLVIAAVGGTVTLLLLRRWAPKGTDRRLLPTAPVQCVAALLCILAHEVLRILPG